MDIKNMTPQNNKPLTKIELLEKLFEPFKNCTRCPLGSAGRSQVVFGLGNPDAQLMFVGEGPGRDEDIQGKPFVGRAGQLLTKILEAMQLKREDVWISNVVKCRPPENRTPLPIERSTCSSLLLFKEIEIIKPSIICALGTCATQALLNKPDIALSKVRGIFQPGHNALIMPTYHPAYLLRNPDAKRFVWEDMKKVMKCLSKEPFH